MAKLQCANSNSYSSPVPIIGLYVAIASFVCLLLMLWDIFFAIRRKARYVPCRLFSLNSFTMTLLAIVSKLPVDLTTTMPSARDQLSKLTGTAMTCICIGFMAPSLASTNRESESFANMAALSIFVVTIAVNICIQMATEVVFSFFVEHLIILCCLFMLLAIFWYNTFDFNAEKPTLIPTNAAHFLTIPNGEPSLMHRVKSWYISSCIFNPQLLLCRAPLSSAIGPICILCSLVLLQATYRSIIVRKLDFCNGISDYGWSMWIIVITQIVTIIIGALTIAFRWLVVVGHLDGDREVAITDELEDLTIQFSFMKRRSIRTSIMVLSRFSLKLVLLVFLFFIHGPILAISCILSFISVTKIGTFIRSCMYKTRNDIVSLGSWEEEFDFHTDLDGLSQQIILLRVNNMNKWMNVKRDSSSNNLVQMLPRSPSGTPLLNKFLEFGNELYKSSGYKVTCLTMVILLKVVTATIPSCLTKSMSDTLDEAFEIVYYIDKKMNVESTDSKNRQLAKLFWKGGDIDISKNILLENPNDPVKCAISHVERALDILSGGFTNNTDALMVMKEFIKDREYNTIEEFCEYIKQLFSEMLQHFLAQLPICVFKEVNDGSVEDCEERARFITKLFCKLDSSLEDKVRWIFPDGWPANTSPIFDLPQDSHGTNAQSDISTEDGGNATAQNIA